MLLPYRETALFLLLSSCATASTPVEAVSPEAPNPAVQQEGTLGFYRYPALRGDTIVFAAEGDLWKVDIEGGVAYRLTTHASEEQFPTISPDGRTLAFTAHYEGVPEVYTMPLAGGAPTRWTFEADPSVATTWTPDGKLVYATRAYTGLPRPRLVVLDLQTGTRELEPLAYASEGTYDDTGDTLFFCRPAFHRNVTKRYTGGTARDVWKFERGAEEAVELTGDWNGESHSPMWWQGRVWFVRGNTMNLHSMYEDGSGARQLTKHSGWDVRNPSLDAGRIVYSLGADLWLFDIETKVNRKVPITLASDFDQTREKWITEPMKHLTSAHLHPNGKSVVLTSRGRVFVAPAKGGRLVRASRKDHVRFRDVVFAPNGKTLLGLSDETGELEFVELPGDGVGAGRRLTSDGEILRFRGHPSPDGQLIAWLDKNNDIWVLDVETGVSGVVSEHREGRENQGDMAWSPDGRWLAFSEPALNTFEQIKLFDSKSGRTHLVTSDRVNSFNPVWDPGGEFLYFISDRNLRSLVPGPWGTRQPEPYFDKEDEVYAVALREGLRSPFRPDDELYDPEKKKKKEPKEEKSEGEEEKKITPVEIDLEGLGGRLARVPVTSGNYRSLWINDKALFFLARDSGPGAKSHLTAVKVGDEKAEPVTMIEDVRSIELSLDGKKLLVRKGSDLYVIDAKPAKVADLKEHSVDLGGWSYSIDVRDDWRQIFVDAWRLERDYFYDPKMHGVDWVNVLKKHLPLVERVTTRDELNELIGWMVGELSALHTSVRGGDLRKGNDEVKVATLGARIFRDPAAGGFRIDHIYRTDPDYPGEMAPLADPYLGVNDGDVITAVNGTPALEAKDIGALLRNQVGRQVLLRVKSETDDVTVERDLVVVPAGDERQLRYRDWVLSRRRMVDEAGDEKIGYVHLSAMGNGNLTQWYRQFYPVFDRQGLIVDVRSNFGGNIDSIILEKLQRKAWMYWKGRVNEPYWNQQFAFRGHLVVLCDQDTYSDGEAFAEGARRLGLGVVIGMRTWGGEIWLSSDNRLTDGGLARAPMSGVYGPEGEWLIEQIGVIPDIEVDNLPHATFNGSDAQLETAVKHLLERIAEDPRAVPQPPPHPDKSYEY